SRIQPSVEPSADKPKIDVAPRKQRWKKIGEAWFYSAGDGWRRHLGPLPKEVEAKLAAVGVPQLKVVDQARHKPEPEPEHEKKAAQAEPAPKSEKEEGKALAVVRSAPAEEWDDAIAAMNRQHAIIENVGGKAVIASWEPSTYDTGKLMVVFQNKESFLLR